MEAVHVKIFTIDIFRSRYAGLGFRVRGSGLETLMMGSSALSKHNPQSFEPGLCVQTPADSCDACVLGMFVSLTLHLFVSGCSVN